MYRELGTLSLYHFLQPLGVRQMCPNYSMASENRLELYHVSLIVTVIFNFFKRFLHECLFSLACANFMIIVFHVLKVAI